tara:strand:+ start:381 stop:1547 length:1167 start_codon:yes stop_codon:yes gene_type:complete
MTLIDIANYVCNLVNKTDDTSKARCKEFIRQHHENIINSGLWRETVDVEQMTLPYDGRITQIILDDGGTGYTSAPTIAFSPNTDFAAATAEVDAGSVTRIYITNPGANFTSAPTISFSGGAGSGASATAIVSELADEMTCPQQFESILGISYNEQNLLPTQLITEFMTDPESFKNDTHTAQFSVIDSSGINFNIHGQLDFLSSDSADNGKQITVVGTLLSDSYFIQKETLTLASSVTTTNSYSAIHSLSKETTDGYVQVRSNATPTDRFFWPEWENVSKFQRVKFFDRPNYSSDSPVNLYVIGKKKIQPMVDDYDSAMISGIDNVLIHFATGDMLKRSRQFGKAQLEIQQANSLMQVVRDQENNQSAKETRLIPDAYGMGYSRDDFGF